MGERNILFLCIISNYFLFEDKIFYPLAILHCFFQITMYMFSIPSRACKIYSTLCFVNVAVLNRYWIIARESHTVMFPHHLLGTIRNMKGQVDAIWTESTWMKTQKTHPNLKLLPFGFNDESFRKEIVWEVNWR